MPHFKSWNDYGEFGSSDTDTFEFVVNVKEKTGQDTSATELTEFDDGQQTASDGHVPTERLSLNFEEIKVTISDAAVLDFELTGDPAFSPGIIDDFTF
ncbi:hypothetical protein ABVF61_23420 [Roseibium sp. HPY-6]|uniref:hypothetical protein n=1 Tax=Roseibium sp. HPY-6 TaxID=3229852 RepID=UPI00338DAA9C